MLIGMVIMAFVLVVGIVLIIRTNYFKSHPSDYASTMSSDTVNESVSDNEEDYSADTDTSDYVSGDDEYADDSYDGTTDSDIGESADQDYETDEIYNNDSDSLLAEYGISADTIEDYSANLDPSQYLYCNAGIGEMTFYYPAYLFNDVSVDETQNTTIYGTNLKTITFSGSQGSQLIYSVYQRTDGASLSDETNMINQNEHSIYSGISDIVVSADSEKGRIVLAGPENTDGGNQIYDLIKIDNNYVYQMLSVKVPYASEDERIKYAYVTENEYRLCGFSGSSNSPRSYEEFLESNP